MSTTEFQGPLNGIKVVDLSKILAGPYATMSLADMGAEVIKVEHPDGGDPTRAWGPPFLGDDSTYFLAINRNKQSVTVDLKSAEGQEYIFSLLEDTDVVVENFRPDSSLQKIFDYKELSERFPHLVVLHISAFGDHGPLKDEPGYDMIAQAAGGVMSLTGEEDGPPAKTGYAIGDLGASVFGTIGLLAALVERERTGQGQYVTTSLYESQLAMHINWASNYFATGKDPHRMGSKHPNLAPYQAYKAADTYFVIAVGNDAMWQRLCMVLGRADLAHDEQLATNRGRVVNRDYMNMELEKTLAARTAADWVEILKASEVPVSPIRTLAEVYDHPQTHALEMVQTVDHPVIGELKQVAFPVNFRGQRPPVTVAPPVLGEQDARAESHTV